MTKSLDLVAITRQQKGSFKQTQHRCWAVLCDVKGNFSTFVLLCEVGC